MSRGAYPFTFACPDCDDQVEGTVTWYSHPGTREDPPEDETSVTYPDACPHCGGDLTTGPAMALADLAAELEGETEGPDEPDEPDDYEGPRQWWDDR